MADQLYRVATRTVVNSEIHIVASSPEDATKQVEDYLREQYPKGIDDSDVNWKDSAVVTEMEHVSVTTAE